MRDQRIPGHAPDDPVNLKEALLGLVVCDHPGLWTLAELDRALQPSSETPTGCEPNRSEIEDAVEDLYAAGLVHRLGQFVVATRAAHAAHRLAG